MGRSKEVGLGVNDGHGRCGLMMIYGDGGV